MNWSRSLGPGLLVTAAFIGPGTITTASLAGANFGFALLWALAFSVFATIVLQEMSARLGLVSREGLGESLRTAVDNPGFRLFVVLLVVAAITFGNAAFQTGNIMGAAMGLEALTGTSRQLWSLVVGVAAFSLLASGTYKLIEGLLVLLVAVMAIVFLVTAMIVPPRLDQMVAGLTMPSLPRGSLLTIIALVGTTVVPYNLFLHSSAVREKWPEAVPLHQALKQSRLDTFFSITLGGIITLAIMATAAAAFFQQSATLKDAATMAEQLEPLLGHAAKYFFATGLLAAGLTSAITAPLAAAYATAGALGWERNLRGTKFRAVWALIVVAGTVLSLLGKDPVPVIVVAQAANGMLLPLIAVFLLVVMNRRDLLREYKNGALANALGCVVVLTAAGLGIFQLLKVCVVVTG